MRRQLQSNPTNLVWLLRALNHCRPQQLLLAHSHRRPLVAFAAVHFLLPTCLDMHLLNNTAKVAKKKKEKQKKKKNRQLPSGEQAGFRNPKEGTVLLELGVNCSSFTSISIRALLQSNKAGVVLRQGSYTRTRNAIERARTGTQVCLLDPQLGHQIVRNSLALLRGLVVLKNHLQLHVRTCGITRSHRNVHRTSA